MSDKQEKFEALKSMAKKARERAKEYDDLARENRTLAQDYENQAAALCVPFKVGDVIEYQTTTYGRHQRTITRRTLVKLMREKDGTIAVDGTVVRTDGTLSAVRADSWFGDGMRDKFIRVVRPADSVAETLQS